MAGFVLARHRQSAGRIIPYCLLAAVTLHPEIATAQKSKSFVSGIEREAQGPLIAVVSVGQQSLQVFDRDGLVARARVSTGRDGYRTPTGIFSVIQKQIDHVSNIYDAEMPYMQRITWSGIALHAGVVPGYPASHGCIRLPYDFARSFYRVTDLGMRVIVSPEALAPQPIAHQALFTPRAVDVEPLMARIGPKDGQAVRTKVAAADTVAPTSARPVIPGVMRLGVATPSDAESGGAAPAGAAKTQAEAAPTLAVLRQQARAALASANKALQVERQAADAVRNRHGKVLADVTKLERAIAVSQNRLDAAQQAQERAKSERAKQAAADAERKASEQLAAATAALEALAETSKTARAERDEAIDKVKAAEAQRNEAQALVSELDRMVKPVHAMVSLKTGKIYVRQGYEPILEAPVTISEPGKPIGTHVFTAMTTGENTATWSVVTMKKDSARRGAVIEPATAAAALDRVTIPEDVRQRISEMLSPGSSLIIADEAPSGETGKGTDIIVSVR